MQQPAINKLSDFGPFFALLHHPEGAQPVPSWRPMRELVEQPDVLRARIETVRNTLAASAGRDAEQIPLRVAASITQMGLVARLIAPAVASTVMTGRPLDMRLARLWWRNELGGAFPLSLAVSEGTPAAGGHGQNPVEASWLDDPVASITDTVMACAAVSPRVLWGNVASALNSAATQIARRRPDLARPAYALAAATLGDARLSQERGTSGPTFRRTSCCLIYRLVAGPPAAVCGDCVLNRGSR